MKFTALAAAAAAVCLAAPALADDSGRAVVRYADLDLSTQAGQAALDQRIDAAAHAMCGTEVSTGTILPNRKISRCVARAKESVNKSVADRIAADRSRG